MKKVTIAILCLCAFIACLAIGFLSGVLKTPEKTTDGKVNNTQRTVTPPKYLNQQNLLLFQVDYLAQSRPRLESAWLMITMPDQPKLTLVMLYPSAKESYQKLADQFKLSPAGGLDPDFSKTLLTLNFGYQGFILIDEAGFNQWIEWLGGVDVGSGKQDGAAILKQMPKPWSDIDNAVIKQKITSKSICNAMSLLPLETDWSSLLVKLVPDHLRSNLTLQETVNTWHQMKDRQARFNCDVETP